MKKHTFMLLESNIEVISWDKLEQKLEKKNEEEEEIVQKLKFMLQCSCALRAVKWAKPLVRLARLEKTQFDFISINKWAICAQKVARILNDTYSYKLGSDNARELGSNC
jgi:hypothetical protein